MKEIKCNVLFVCASKECQLKEGKGFYHRCEHFSPSHGIEYCTNKAAQLKAAKKFIEENEDV